MTPEEAHFRERDVQAREKQAEQELHRNKIMAEALRVEEKKSKRHFAGMILMAVIGFGGAAFGTLYVKHDKDKDISALHKKIDKLNDRECTDKIRSAHLSYVTNTCEKMMNYHRKTWAEMKVKKILKNSK